MKWIITFLAFNKQIKKIKYFLKKEHKINNNKVLGRAWVKQDKLSVLAYLISGSYNFNNIIMQARSEIADSENFIKYEGTFNTSRFLEKEVLRFVSKIINWKHKDFSGYITGGGTESNIYSMWIARNLFYKSENKKNFWLVPNTSHYSIFKGADVLGLDYDKRNIIEVFLLKKNEYKINVHDIAKKAAQESFSSNVFVVLTMMTTQYGIVDDASLFIEFFKQNNGDLKNLYLHIDACYGGTVLPFVDGFDSVNLIPPEASSVSVDFHKITGGPIGSGVVILKSDLEKFSRSSFASSKASYITDGWDYTLSGSRNGLSAIQLWVLFKKISKNNYFFYKKKIDKSCQNAMWLANSMINIQGIEVPINPVANQFFFLLNENLEIKRKEIENFLYGYSISGHIESLDNNDNCKIYKVIVNYNHTKKVLKKFLKEFKMIINLYE